MITGPIAAAHYDEDQGMILDIRSEGMDRSIVAAPDTALAAVLDAQFRRNGNVLNIGDIVTIHRVGWEDHLTRGVPIPAWDVQVENVTINTDDGDEATEQFAVPVMSLVHEPSDDEPASTPVVDEHVAEAPAAPAAPAEPDEVESAGIDPVVAPGPTDELVEPARRATQLSDAAMELLHTPEPETVDVVPECARVRESVTAGARGVMSRWSTELTPAPSALDLDSHAPETEDVELSGVASMVANARQAMHDVRAGKPAPPEGPAPTPVVVEVAPRVEQRVLYVAPSPVVGLELEDVAEGTPEMTFVEQVAYLTANISAPTPETKPEMREASDDENGALDALISSMDAAQLALVAGRAEDEDAVRILLEIVDDEVTGEIGPALASLTGFQLSEVAQLAIDLATNISQQAA